MVVVRDSSTPDIFFFFSYRIGITNSGDHDVRYYVQCRHILTLGGGGGAKSLAHL